MTNGFLLSNKPRSWTCLQTTHKLLLGLEVHVMVIAWLCSFDILAYSVLLGFCTFLKKDTAWKRSLQPIKSMATTDRPFTFVQYYTTSTPCTLQAVLQRGKRAECTHTALVVGVELGSLVLGDSSFICCVTVPP